MKTTLNHKQIAELIKAVGADRTVLVQGEAGTGKTTLLYALAKDPYFANYHVVNPIDCTQMSDGSVWVPDVDREAGVSRELPNERFGISKGNHRGVDGSQPILLCFDEIAKARQYIKDTIAPIIYEHRIGEYRMPKGSVVFACTNLGSEGLGDTMQAHLRDRVIDVTLRKPTAEEWTENFALPHDLHPAILACVQEYPQVFESFTDYEPDGVKAGRDLTRENPYIFNPRATQDKWASPRSLHASSDILHKGGALDSDTITAALNGTIGKAYTALLMAYVRFGQSLPAFSVICADPTGTPVPVNPGAKVMLAFRLIQQVQDRLQAEAVSQYMSRFPGEMKLLFASNVSNNTKKMGLFSRSATFTKDLAASLKVLNA
jgi:GTPase SAR1 family protein